MKFGPIYIFGFLCILFLGYSMHIYWLPVFSKDSNDPITAEKIAAGRQVWQKYNCQACHQLYGLGGYLGPDLTNVYSRLYESPEALKIFFKGGLKQMPVFNMSPEEEDLLVEFLKATDKSGSADPRNFHLQKDGMIQAYENK